MRKLHILKTLCLACTPCSHYKLKYCFSCAPFHICCRKAVGDHNDTICRAIHLAFHDLIGISWATSQMRALFFRFLLAAGQLVFATTTCKFSGLHRTWENPMSFRKNLVRESPHVFPHFGFLNRIKSLDSGWLIMAGLATRSSAGPSNFTSTEVIFICKIHRCPQSPKVWFLGPASQGLSCEMCFNTQKLLKNSSYPSRHTVAFKHVNMVPLCASHRPADTSFDTTVARFPFLGRQARGKKHSIG